MRLLNVETLRLTSFPDASLAPPYAILSHRWEEDEVLFEDLQDDPLEDLVASLQTRLELLERKQASDKVGFSTLEPAIDSCLGSGYLLAACLQWREGLSAGSYVTKSYLPSLPRPWEVPKMANRHEKS